MRTTPNPDDTRTTTRAARACARVLLVSSDPATRAEVGGFLRGAGYRVEEPVGNLALLYRAGRRRHPRPPQATLETLIIDCTAAPERGLALLEEVRSEDWSVPVVLLSDDRRVEHRARRLGANAVLPRPLDLEVLKRVLGNLAPAPGAPSESAGGRVVPRRAERSQIQPS